MIDLIKGQKVNLQKDSPTVQVFGIGCGWNPQKSNGQPFDLDASIIMLSNGKMKTDKSIVYYNNPKSTCGSVLHSGDNLTGEGEGDDEIIKVDLSKVPSDVNELLIVVNIYDAKARRQNFGQVKDAFIRIFDANGDKTKSIMRYDLSEDFSTQIAVTFGRLYKHNDEWKFEANGTGVDGGLNEYLEMYK